MNVSLRKSCLELTRIESVPPLKLSTSAHHIFEHIGGFFDPLGHFFRCTLTHEGDRYGLFSRSNSIVPVRENANGPAANTALLAIVWARIQHQVERFAIRPIDGRDPRRNGNELLSAVRTSLEVLGHQDTRPVLKASRSTHRVWPGSTERVPWPALSAPADPLGSPLEAEGDDSRAFVPGLLLLLHSGVALWNSLTGVEAGASLVSQIRIRQRYRGVRKTPAHRHSQPTENACEPKRCFSVQEKHVFRTGVTG